MIASGSAVTEGLNGIGADSPEQALMDQLRAAPGQVVGMGKNWLMLGAVVVGMYYLAAMLVKAK